MALVLYDTLTKGEKEFTPLIEGKVTMYTCGPTVYGRPHIGNYSSFLMADLLRRWLEVSDYKVTHVKNITDVGHLVADADTGEDKIEKQAREEFGSVTMESVLKIARGYEDEYLQDEKLLNMVEPEHRPRATEYVEKMKTMTEQLLQAKKAYVTDDGIYFDVTSFPAYGKLSGNTLDQLHAGSRVQVDANKHHPADFALWKFCVGQNEHHVLRWPSPKGVDGEIYPEGFPGWHIECSAMSAELLGEQIDIHTGGEDNIFPHHECEIAQSESITGKTFVRLWLHKRRIDLEGDKMSKSLGNIVTISHITDKGYDALDLRYYLLSVHYRTNLKFSWKGMDDSKMARRTILEWISRKGGGEFAPFVAPGKEIPTATVADIEAFESKFDSSMDNDLNVSSALASVFECIHKMNTVSMPTPDVSAALKKFIEKIQQTFGCFEPKNEDIPANVQALVDERAAARAAKNFAESDRLRDAIAQLGYDVRDTADGQVLRRT